MKETVIIPLGTDLNDGLPPTPPENSYPDFLPMDDDIFDDLPPLLRAACEKLTTPTEQETFLIGALGVLSGMLPKVQGIYFGKTVGANLYCFVMGKYGTGKGALTWAKQLGAAVHNYRKEQSQTDLTRYAEAMVDYNKELRLYEKGKRAEQPPIPKPANHLKLFLAANTTKTAVMQLLWENEGRGVIFETEGDTLSDMLRQDYGNFSDVLRKAFHHEEVSYYRRANNEDVEITNPALSVVLSGTEDQLRRLIPSVENGLFSRFMFYVLQDDYEFNDPFSKTDTDNQYYFNTLASRFLTMYQQQEQQDEPVYFALREEQEQAFRAEFKSLKKDIYLHVSNDLNGTVNRMALITYRIAMILTSIRFIDSLHGTIYCTATDFNNALAISKHLLHYNLHVYELLGRKGSMDVLAPLSDMSKKEKVAECCRQYKMGVSTRDIALSILGTKKKSSTVFKWINKFCKTA